MKVHSRIFAIPIFLLAMIVTIYQALQPIYAFGPQNIALTDTAELTATNTYALITEYSLPNEDSHPSSITSGPDGNIWFTEILGEDPFSPYQIGKITVDGTVTEFAIPMDGSNSRSIVAGPDDALWFVESELNKVAQISQSGVITEFVIPTADSRPLSITAGPDDNLWFTEYNAHQIGRVTTTGTFTEYMLPADIRLPTIITVGPDGKLWFTAGCDEDGHQIGQITTGGVISKFSIAADCSVWTVGSIVSGPDGNLWIVEQNYWSAPSNNIIRMGTDGTYTRFNASGARDITVGPQGNLWFTDDPGNQIGRITTTGIITTISVPTANSRPLNITTGPDNNIWFTEFDGNKIGKLTLPLLDEQLFLPTIIRD